MKFALKTLGLMLIPVIVLAITTGTRMNADNTSVPSLPLGERLAPCHAHGAAHLPVPLVPSSTPRLPASYLCCLTDHAAAVVQASNCSRPAAQFTRVPPPVEPASAILLLSEHERQTIVFSDPPGRTPLRI
jgi:hypothetical protein